MNPTEIHRATIDALDQRKRPFRLDWGRRQSKLENVLLPQHVDLTEGLCTGIDGTVTCLSARPDLPPETFLGRPVSLQVVTDRGVLHPINGIVANARMGHSDGSLACVQLTVRDALTILEQRVNNRMFRSMSLPNILETLIQEWRGRSPTLARSFDFELLIDRAHYPVREQTRQAGESDAAFIRRLCRFVGIFWFIRAGKRDGTDSDTPVHTLVFCDNPMRLPQSPAGTQSPTGTVPYHHGAAVKDSDSITLLAAARSLVPGGVRRASGDYKTGKMDVEEIDTIIDQGEAGNDLAKLLTDWVIDPPHAGNSRENYALLAKARILAHEHRAECVHGAGDVRNLVPGTWFAPSGHPEMDTREPEQRQHIVVTLRHRATNNFPKALGERAQSLFAASRWQVDALPLGEDGQSRYENTFVCVRRGVPLTPAFDPRIDFPPVKPFSAWVVAGQGEAAHCDEYGRIKVQIPGLHPDDHAHAHGAGTSGTERDSAWVRLLSPWAGPNYGMDAIPRPGMEVLIDHLGGDPDKMIVLGTVHGGPNMPATFNNTGSLPGNKHLSGIKTKEVDGPGSGQLRFDDTPGEVSSQLASTHAASELNLGYLTHPRTDGHGKGRGEGAELATRAAAVVRALQGLMLTTFAFNAGHQLDRDNLNTLLAEGLELFKALGDYAGQHGGTAADTAAQDQLASILKKWDPSGANAGAANDAQAILAFGAAAGSVNLTPKTHVTYAGQNIDQVAQQHLQLTSGQRFNAFAGQGMQWFARGQGIQAIANEGPLVLQAQADTVAVTAQKGIKIATNENEVLITGKTVCFVAEDGSYIRIGDGRITLGTNGPVELLGASHDWGGPSTLQAKRTEFAKAPTDQRFRAHYASDTQAPTAYAANQPHGIRLPDGGRIEGKSDAGGLTDTLKDDAMRIARIDMLKPKL
ncbi:type VI secretion system Vgr family protein [Ralstonia pseudosolanacearum]|uniref:type VI secretion system Vgr family protein n=1 Tax=Ralstonia pseudosolanacearum TaxID=1310165 RepID=UPI003CFCF1D1